MTANSSHYRGKHHVVSMDSDIDLDPLKNDNKLIEIASRGAEDLLWTFDYMLSSVFEALMGLLGSYR